MDKEQFQNAIKEVLAKPEEVEGIIILILKDGSLALLNVDGVDQKYIIEQYAKYVESKCLKEEFELKNYSSADNRGDCYYVYDLKEMPDCFKKLQIKKAEQEGLVDFNDEDHKLSEVKGIIVIITDGEKELKLFKNVSNVEIIGAAKMMYFHTRKSHDRFERVKSDMIKLTPTFDTIMVDDEVIIVEIKHVERIQQLTQITINEATAKLSDVEKIGIIENLEKINDLVSGDLSLAKKLIQVVNESQVLYKGIPNDKIIAFAKKKEKKFGRMTYSEDGSQFSIQGKTEFKRLLQILNNDLLRSELTDDDYLTKAKDHLKEA